MTLKPLVLTAVALAIAGCHPPDTDHPKLDYTSSLLNRMSPADIDRVTTPRAPPERGPIPPDANFADPATNASLAFPEGHAMKSIVPPPGSDNSPEGQHLAVMAEDAAARAPDTASADEAKRKVYEDAARGISPPAKDAKATPDTESDAAAAAPSDNPSAAKVGNS